MWLSSIAAAASSFRPLGSDAALVEEEPILVETRCAWCRRLFHVCEADWRGQLYCSPTCGERGDLRRKRSARARHQRSDEGRLDHRDRQRRYRARQRARRVTDHGREKLASKVKSAHANERQHDLFEQEGATHGDANGEPRLHVDRRHGCVVCGRRSSRVRRPYPRHVESLLRVLLLPKARGPPA